MRLLFLGSGEFGLPTLAFLHRTSDHEVAAVISQPDRPAGRKRRLTATPIAQWAAQHGIPVLKTDDVNDDAFVSQVAAMCADASIVIAFGQKLGEPFIAALGKLVVNLHASLLPKYRGAAPINWAMIHGERTTGVSVIGLAQRMDAGEVYAKADLAIDPHETAGELHDRLAQLGPDAIARVLNGLENSTLSPKPQDEASATKAPKLTKADGTVDFNQPAEAVRNRIHGLTPWPGCRVQWHCRQAGITTPLILHRARVADQQPEPGSHEPGPGIILPDHTIATAAGAVDLLELQPPGKPVMPLVDFLHGHHLAPGDRLGPIDRGE